MSFQDELRQSLRTPAQVQAEEHNRPEASRTLDTLRREMIAAAKSAAYSKTGKRAAITAITPISQRFIQKRRMDNNSQLIANNKLGIFKNRSVVYQVWYTFELNPRYAEEYTQFTRILRQLAKEDGISVDFVLYDKRTKQCHPFPTRLDGFQFESDFALAVKGTSHVNL